MKHQKVAQLVKKDYLFSKDDFAQWMWKNHVQFVAHKAEELSKRFGASEDLAVAGAWLHDFGDAFIDRDSSRYEEVFFTEAKNVLQNAGYTESEIREIIDVIIEPHSCKQGNFPTTPEGKILATADAFAHLTTDFYVQFTWMNLPKNKSYSEFIDWVNEKIDRDFNKKIFFEEVKEEVEHRYKSLLEVFGKTNNT